MTRGPLVARRSSDGRARAPCGGFAGQAVAWRARLAVLAGALVLVAGCASPGEFKPPAALREPSSTGLAPDAPAVAVAPAWWKAFDEPELNALVDRALAENPRLELAEARMARASAAVAGAVAGTHPRVDAGLDVTRQRYTENGIFPPPIGGSTLTSANLQASATWELDFFGRHRAALDAALGSERAARAESDAARVLLASHVARGYFQLARLGAQRKLAERSLAQRQELLALVRQREGAGLDTAVELRQAEGAVPDARAQIEAIDEQLALARHALAALSAQPYSALDALTPRLGTVRAVPVPQRLPVDLLGRRADVAAARSRVEAAGADVALARTRFYPNIDLTAFVGLNAIGLDRLFEFGSRNLGAGPAVRLPIFDGGRLRANLQGKAAELDAAIASYNATLVDAVRDAADQVASLASIARQQHEQARAEAAAESAYDLALQRYRAGLGTYLIVLIAESSVLAQRRAGADLLARALDAQVQLAHALGGGYAGTTTEQS